MCVLMRALFQQRWSPYVRHELETGPRIEATEPKPEAKVIAFASPA
jgi:hypothetical protein